MIKYILPLLIALSILLACVDDNRQNVATPLPPVLPDDYTPVATADYH